MNQIIWYEDTTYKKKMGQMRLQVGAVLQPLMMYGQKDVVDGAIIELMKLIEDFGLNIRGIKEKPISLDYIRRRR